MGGMTPEALARFCKASPRIRALCDDKSITQRLSLGKLRADEKLRGKFFTASILLCAVNAEDEFTNIVNSKNKRYSIQSFSYDGRFGLIRYMSPEYKRIKTLTQAEIENYDRGATVSLFFDYIVSHPKFDMITMESGTEVQLYEQTIVKRGYGSWVNNYTFIIQYSLFKLWAEEVGYKRAIKTIEDDIEQTLSEIH